MKSITIIEVCAILIALLALVTSVSQFFMQRHHNELSVRPLLVLRHEWDNELNTRTVFIQNVGFGPAIVDRAYVIQPDGHEAELNTSLFSDFNFNYPAASWQKGINLESFECSPPAVLSGDGLMTGEVILPGEKIVYVRFHRLDKKDGYEFKMWAKEFENNKYNKGVEKKNYIDPGEYSTDPFSVLLNFFEKTRIHVKYRSLYNKKQIDFEDRIYRDIDSII